MTPGAIITPLPTQTEIELDCGELWIATPDHRGRGWLAGPMQERLGPFESVSAAVEFCVRFDAKGYKSESKLAHGRAYDLNGNRVGA